MLCFAPEGHNTVFKCGINLEAWMCNAVNKRKCCLYKLGFFKCHCWKSATNTVSSHFCEDEAKNYDCCGMSATWKQCLINLCLTNWSSSHSWKGNTSNVSLTSDKTLYFSHSKCKNSSLISIKFAQKLYKWWSCGTQCLSLWMWITGVDSQNRWCIPCFLLCSLCIKRLK